MWGLLFFAMIGIGVFINSYKNDMDNTRRRENSRQNKQDYYMDNIGKDRRVDNNHQVVRTFKHCNESGRADDVLMDLKTGQVLHNYSEDERGEEKEEINKIIQKNIEARKKAREKGAYSYMAFDEPPVIDGFYEDMYATMYIRNPYNLSPRQRKTRCHYRRVSDNLLLDPKSGGSVVRYEGGDKLYKSYNYQPFRDARCHLNVYDTWGELTGDKESIYKCAKENWKTIKEWEKESFYRTLWRSGNPEPFPTSAEVEAYAKKIGAYLDIGKDLKDNNVL